MAAERPKRAITYRVAVAAEPMPAEDLRAVELLVARLVARAYAADHPGLFRPAVPQMESEQSSGPPAAAAAVAGALPAHAGGPDKESREHDCRTKHEDT